MNELDAELKDYIEDNQDIEKTPYIIKQKEINLLLSMNGFGELGDLFDPSLFSVNKTLTVVKNLCDDRKKLIEAKTSLLQKMTKSEKEYNTLFKNHEIAQGKITELTNINNFMKNKIFKEEKSFKEDIEKLKGEKEDLIRQLSKTQTKETKWKYEIKKKEIELSDIKNKLRKYMNDKDLISNSMSTNGINVNMKINQTLNNINYATPSKEVLISFENLIKNSNTVLLNVNHLKEFYNLLFQAFNEKINYITNENNDLRECYKIILREINKYMDFKKLLLQKLSKDALTTNKINKNENINNKINEGLLNMDFNESREQVLNNFNEILNSFRYILIYDLLKVDPSKEFNYDEMTKQITNTKYDLKNLPYYKDISDLMENFDVNALKTLKNTLDNLDMETQELEKKNGEINNEIDLGDINTDELINDNKSLQILEDINKDFSDTLNFLDEKINGMKDKMERNTNFPQ